MRLLPNTAIKRFADLDGPDFFPTPAWATHALIDNEKFVGDIWECACGNGAMSDVLETRGNNVVSSDLFQRGYGEGGVDFLEADRAELDTVQRAKEAIAKSANQL